MSNIMNNEAKIAVVVEAIKSGDKLVKKSFAAEHNIDPRTLSRWMEKFSDDAKSIIDNEQKQNEKIKNTKRGGKPRNGRVLLVTTIIGELGVDAETSVIYQVALERATKEDMPTISKGSWYSIIHQIRKSIKGDS